MVSGMWMCDLMIISKKKIKSHVKVNSNKDKESLMYLNLNLLHAKNKICCTWYHTKTHKNNYINKNYNINTNAKEPQKTKNYMNKKV